MNCESCANYAPKPEPKPARKMPEWAYVGATVHWDGVSSATGIQYDAKDVVLKDATGHCVGNSINGTPADFIVRDNNNMIRYTNIEHLSPIPAKPEPHKVGDWVVPTGIDGLQDGKPVRIGIPTSVNPAHLRPATAEDFKMDFYGVKVWMERIDGCVYEHIQTKNGIGIYPLTELQSIIHTRGGVMFMPEEYWGEK